MTWIQTQSGVKFTPLDPKPQDVNVEDIAHALSMKCRFTGHTKRFYSVAQHCCIMAELPIWESFAHESYARLCALLHDAAEAYLPDIARPIKSQFYAWAPGAKPERKPLLHQFEILENRLMATIHEAFGLPWPIPTGLRVDIQTADRAMLATEFRDLMGPAPCQWESIRDVTPLLGEISPWGPKTAAKRFLGCFTIFQEGGACAL